MELNMNYDQLLEHAGTRQKVATLFSQFNWKRKKWNCLIWYLLYRKLHHSNSVQWHFYLELTLNFSFSFSFFFLFIFVVLLQNYYMPANWYNSSDVFSWCLLNFQFIDATKFFFDGLFWNVWRWTLCIFICQKLFLFFSIGNQT